MSDDRCMMPAMTKWWAISDGESRAFLNDSTPEGGLRSYMWFECAGPEDANIVNMGTGPDGEDWMLDYARDFPDDIGAGLIAQKLGGFAGGFYAVKVDRVLDVRPRRRDVIEDLEVVGDSVGTLEIDSGRDVIGGTAFVLVKQAIDQSGILLDLDGLFSLDDARDALPAYVIAELLTD